MVSAWNALLCVSYPSQTALRHFLIPSSYEKYLLR